MSHWTPDFCAEDLGVWITGALSTEGIYPTAHDSQAANYKLRREKILIAWHALHTPSKEGLCFLTTDSTRCACDAHTYMLCAKGEGQMAHAPGCSAQRAGEGRTVQPGRKLVW